VKSSEINTVDRHVAQETLSVVYSLFSFKTVVSFICSHSGNIMCEMSKNFTVYFEGVGDRQFTEMLLADNNASQNP